MPIQSRHTISEGFDGGIISLSLCLVFRVQSYITFSQLSVGESSNPFIFLDLTESQKTLILDITSSAFRLSCRYPEVPT